MSHQRLVALFSFALLAAAAGPAHAEPRRPADHRAVVVRHTGHRAVVEGASVAKWLPHVPLWCFETKGDELGLLLFHAEVVSVQGTAAAIDVPADEAELLRDGAVCEPRWVAEARAFHQTPVTDAERAAEKAAADKPAPPQVRVRHRPPQNAPWGKPIWLEAVLEGPADKLMALWRPGQVGPYQELPLEAKGDGLFGAALVVPQSEPAATIVQYYLIAQGTAGRTLVFAHPADPHTLQLDAAPMQEEDQLVMHGPVDRASHHEALEIVAQINKRFSKPTLFYRARGSGSYRSLAMQPMGPEQFRAVIPGREVVAPGLAYYITVSDEKGIARNGFGSARSPQTVTVLLPQILSEDDNRNRIGVRYGYTNHGATDDAYHTGEASLERLFFGFLIARLSAVGYFVHSQRAITTGTGATAITTNEMAALRYNLGRAGLDFHLGDYVSLSCDFAMSTYRGGSGAGYRAVVNIGDERVASIDLGIEQHWDVDGGDRVFDVRRGSLVVPLGDSWRLSATAAQERVLTDAPKAIRLVLGLEVDLGSHVQLGVTGGAAGRRDQLGGSGGGGAMFKF
ncbi:MAG: hypothetical protein HY902_14235 [Deltaproteobacteria bacterium]|nr:hypothetical protein [Deltaproteobacteria bacterium]